MIQVLLRRWEVVQFDSSCLVFSGDEAASNGWNDHDDNHDACCNVADASLPPLNNFATHLSACARHVSSVPTLCLRQLEAASKLTLDRLCMVNGRVAFCLSFFGT